MEDTIWKRFSGAAAKAPEKEAILCDGSSVCYGELFETCVRYCEAFRQRGVHAGMHVGLWVEKSADFAAALLALLCCGAVAVPLNTSSKAEAIEISSKAADLNRIVYSRRMTVRASALKQDTRQKLILLGDEEQVNRTQQNVETPCDNCLFLMTSGSTGTPKIAVISQEAMLYRLDLEAMQFSLDQNDRVLISTPVYHSLGIRFLLTALTRGMTVVLPRAFQAQQWLRLIHDNRITYTITVPAQISEILAATEKDAAKAREMLISIRYILSTSAYLPEKIKQAFLPLISGTFLNFIASSETEFMAWADCRWDDPEGDLLGESFPSVDLLILRDEKPADQGEVGEIVSKSRQLFSGYYGDPALTEAAFWNGYYRTGDLGFFDQSGRLHYAGRKKNMIICSGVNIYPIDIEQAVSKIPQVRECAAFGIPHPRHGEILAVAAAGDGLTAEMVLRFCLKELSPYQQPREIKIVDQLPRNEVGKVDLKQLIRSCS